MIKYLVIAFVLLVAGERAASAQACAPSQITCPDLWCCSPSEPICCGTECCREDEMCSGGRCMPRMVDPDDLPDVPECDYEASEILVVNRCNDGDDACGCAAPCTAATDCATGCCHQGYCAMACVCGGQGSVAVSPVPEVCAQAGSTNLVPEGLAPIGGFGGTGCGASNHAAPSALLLLALVMLTRRRR